MKTQDKGILIWGKEASKAKNRGNLINRILNKVYFAAPHSREGGNPSDYSTSYPRWIPAFAGMRRIWRLSQNINCYGVAATRNGATLCA